MRGGFAPSLYKNSPLQLGEIIIHIYWFLLERGKACPSSVYGGLWKAGDLSRRGKVKMNAQMQIDQSLNIEKAVARSHGFYMDEMYITSYRPYQA